MSDAQTAPAEQTEAPHTIYDELIAAIRQHRQNFRTQRDNETDHSYIERTLQAIADVPDPIYEALSPEAQAWFAQAAATANANGIAAPPHGFVSAYKPKQPKQPKAKKLIERKQPKAAKSTGPTMGTMIRRAIINDRSITVQALEAMLAQHGFTDIKRTTVFSFQRGSLDTLKVAEEMGRFSWPTSPQPVEEVVQAPQQPEQQPAA